MTILATLVLTVALTGALLAVEPVREAVSAAARGDLGQLREEIDALGGAAALVLVGLALLHVVIPFPAEFPTAAAGFALGFAIGFPLMLVAWTLSSVAAYWLARVVAPPVLNRLLGEQRMESANRMVARAGPGTLIILRFVPLIPYNVVSFAAGATRVPFGRFTWTTAVGIAPFTALTALLGERLQSPSLDDPVIWAVLAAVILMVATARPLLRRVRHESREGSAS
jgi:uncharacterized membrane protein YdjX (TVP38/TMEM64 family)